MYAPGTRRHIAKALDLGATPEEIMAVLECVAVLGIHSVAMGAPMLVEEMKARGLG
jgi:alkylhydroperoxidase/carboxymuconolactone decarboxylase family protein YurZ